MSDSPERRMQNRIFSYLVELGALVLRINSGAMVSHPPGQPRRFVRFVTWRIIGTVLASAGVSDLVACIGGRFVAIEVKAPGELDNVTPAQHSFLTAVRKAGGLAIVADDLEIVIDRLEAEVQYGI